MAAAVVGGAGAIVTDNLKHFSADPRLGLPRPPQITISYSYPEVDGVESAAPNPDRARG